MKPSKDEVISKLCKKNFELKQINKDYKKRIRGVYQVLYNVGGALNDNLESFTPQQLKTFFKIRDLIR